MRILQTHADFIEYEPIQKEIEQAEVVEKKKHRHENVLVLFTSVEEGDNEDIAKQSINDVKEFLAKIKINKILIYPFAHLSRNLSKPTTALKIIKEMESYAKNLGIETYRAPFGWNKQLNVKTKAHPLAEQSRVYTVGESKVVVGGKVKRLGKKPTLEAEKLSENDHRIIGSNLDLLSFHEMAPGQVFLHEKGLILKNILIDFIRGEQRRGGYKEISTPQLLNKDLWEISGHLEHYKDLMFFTEIDETAYAVKPMNCPGAILVYKTKNRSYKDLPMRLSEIGIVHRNELSGVLSGLFRVRALTMDDAHIFTSEKQLEEEIVNVVQLVDHVYKTFGFEYTVEFSTRPENFMGSREVWDNAEKFIEKSLKKNKISFKIKEGEGAFYGPKIDFHIKDSLEREWQLATVQIDFQLPERFDINYIGEDGKQHRPVIIHRAIYGSLERFMGILIEHYQGKFPVWLSPVQVRVLPISDDNVKYAENIFKKLKEADIRVELDFESSTVENKIRNAQLQKICYMLVVGRKEESDKTIAVRTLDGKIKYGVKLEEFIKQLRTEIKNFK